MTIEGLLDCITQSYIVCTESSLLLNHCHHDNQLYLMKVTLNSIPTEKLVSLNAKNTYK